MITTSGTTGARVTSTRARAAGAGLPLALAGVLAIVWLAALGAGAAGQGTPAGGREPESLILAVTGHSGGPVAAVALTGTLAYVGSGYELSVLDVSDPSQPTRIGYAMLAEAVQDVAAGGGYAYVAAGFAGVYLYHLHVSGTPLLEGFLNTPGYANAVAAAGGILFVADGYQGLRLVDLTNPTAPQTISAIPLEGGAWGVALGGNHVFVASGSRGLAVLDVSDPANPAVVGALDTAGFGGDVWVAGDVALLAAGNGGLQIVNVSNPFNPTLVGTATLPGAARAVTAADNLAYVAAGSGGLRVVDIAEPGAPLEIGLLDTTGDALDLAHGNGLVLVADWQAGLRVIDTVTPTVPVELSEYGGPALPTTGPAVVGDHALLGLEDELAVLSLSEPSEVAQIGQLTLPADPEALVVAGDAAFVAAGYDGLRVVDISNIGDPALLGWLPLPGFAQDVAVGHQHACVADYSFGLRIVDVTDPAVPVQVAARITAGPPTAVASRDHLCLVVTANGDLLMFDLSTPSQPVQIALLPMGGTASDVAVDGNYAYVAAGQGGLRIVNIGDPSNPQVAGTLSTGGVVQGVLAHGATVYLLESSGRVRLVDVADPQSPAVAAVVIPGGAPLGAAAWHGRVVASLKGNGVAVVGGNLTIHGRVADHNDTPMTGIAVTDMAGRTAASNAAGEYWLTGYLPGSYVVGGASPAFSLVPPTQAVTLGMSSAAGVNFVALAAPVTATVSINQATELVYTDTQGLTTTIALPAGAVSQTATITVTPLLPGWRQGYAFGGHAFDIDTNGNVSFGRPVTITIAYSDKDIAFVRFESELILFRWGEDGWTDAAGTCAPPSDYGHDETGNQIGLSVCRAGRYALFAPARGTFLPAMRSD